MKIQKRQEIEFFGTKTGNANSIALGYATETKNFGEVAVGVMNKSTAAKDPNSPKGVCVDSDATLFSVGCGGSGERKNALEVKGDGSVLISGEDGDINVADKIKQALDTDASIELVKSADSDLQYTLMVNNESRGSINIPKDQFLKNVTYDTDAKQLVFTFVTLDEEEHVERISINDLKDVYTAGDGINIDNNVISADFSSVMTAISDEKTQRETTDNEIKSTLDTKADKDKSIAEIKRLTGKYGRKWNAETDVDMCSDFYQYLLKRGNYCGIYIKCSKSKITKDEDIFFNFSRYRSLRLSYSNNRIYAEIETGDETSHMCSTEYSNLDEDFMVSIVPAKLFYSGIEDEYLCIVLYDISDPQTVYFDGYYDKNDWFNSHVIKGFDKAYELPACVQSFGFISYTNSNNYRVKYADDTYALINTDKNVVIGGKDYNADKNTNAYGFGEGGTTFTRGGTLDVNGSATVRDLTTRSITANGSVTINNELNVERSINTNSTLKAGETTINGTLHVENNDIKSKSIYPANTGSSSLKDPSKGKVPGNYVVTKSNLGKAAHNYDKLFVENIYWSDCIDTNLSNTSLNNEGTIQILNARGINKKPVWIFDGCVDRNYDDGYDCDFLGIYATNYTNDGYHVADTIIFNYSQDTSSEAPYGGRIAFNVFNSTISDGVGELPFIFGNGVHYNEDSKIPFDFIDTNLPNKISLDFNEFGEIGLENEVDSTASVVIKLKNEGGLYLNSGRKGKSTLVYATDGSWFDLTAKADTSSIPTKTSQLTNDSNFITSYTETDPVWTSEKGNYYTKTEIDGKGYLTEHQSLADYAKKTEIPDVNTKADLVDGKLKVDQLPKLDNIAAATTTEDMITKFNALLTDLKAKGYMTADITA